VVINSKQYFPAGLAPSGSSVASASLPTISGVTAVQPLQFTVNPLTKTVAVK
jgi:hypothetical protein